MLKRFAGTLAASACITAVAMTAAPSAAYAQTVNYNIPSGSLRQALDAYARQSGRQVIYRSDDVRSARSRGARGAFSAEAALQAILSGSGFNSRADASGAVAIVRSGGEAEAAGTAANEEGASEIVVTGTNIRGRGPIGSRVIVATRTDIDETGYATVQDYLTTLPQNFAAASTVVNGGSGNFNRGTGVNLRGLGPASTLVVVNGRRQSQSGDNGDFVDISSIPVRAIERVEILTDGASAIYGADAIGGVVNILLRRDFEGAESEIRYGTADGDYEEIVASQIFGTSWSSGNLLVGYQYSDRGALAIADRDYAAADKTTFGGRDFRNAFSNPGNVLNPTTLQPAFAVPAGQNGTSLTPASFVAGTRNLQDPREDTDLLPANESHALFGSLSQRIGASLELFLDARYSARNFEVRLPAAFTTLVVPSSNAFYVNPLGGSAPVRINYSFVEDLGPLISTGQTETWVVSGGASYVLSPTWRIRGYLSVGRERFDNTIDNQINQAALNAALADSNRATAFNPFADGSNTAPATLAAIRSSLVEDGDTRILEANAVANGELLSLPGGPARLAFGGSHRRETLEGTGLTYERNVSAAFAEIVVPVVGPANRIPLVSSFEFSIAGRYEHYSDFGSTFNPKIGVQYSPAEFLSLRGTWGTSFRAPGLRQLDENPVAGVSLITVNDPTIPGNAVILQRTGNNAALNQETADTWSIGFDVRPAIIPGMSLSATLYDIDYRDRIARPGPASTSLILQQEAIWSDIIDRNPSPAALSELCARLTTGSCSATPPRAVVDFRLRNLSRLHVRGLDVQFSQSFSISRSGLTLAVNGNYIFDHEQQVSSALPGVDLVDTLTNPVDLRVRGTASWTLGGFAANIGVNYTDDYVDNINTPNRRIASWTTVDAGLSYSIRSPSTILNGTTLTLRASNLFDRDPPFANVALGFDAANSNPLGRLVSFSVRREW